MGISLICYAAVLAVAQLASAVLFIGARSKRLMIVNVVTLTVSVGSTLLTAPVSVNYR